MISRRGFLRGLLGLFLAGLFASAWAFLIEPALRLRRSRGEVVAAFLAVLELARLNLVQLHQTEGGDILLHRTTREISEEEMQGMSE